MTIQKFLLGIAVASLLAMCIQKARAEDTRKYYLVMLKFDVLPVPHASVEYTLTQEFTSLTSCQLERDRVLPALKPEARIQRDMVCAHVDLNEGQP